MRTLPYVPCRYLLGTYAKNILPNTRTDAAAIGFDDAMIYDEMICDHALRKIPVISLSRQEALQVFDEWKNKEDKIEY